MDDCPQRGRKEERGVCLAKSPPPHPTSWGITLFGAEEKYNWSFEEGEEGGRDTCQCAVETATFHLTVHLHQKQNSVSFITVLLAS